MRKLLVFCVFALAVSPATLAAPERQAACPPALLPLGANAVGPAATAALRADPARNRPQVTAALLARQDAARGGQAKTQCGTAVWNRTVVVYLTDRAMLPAQSGAQRVVFVGRTKGGYSVWARAH